MNKLEEYLETFIEDSTIEIDECKLIFKNSYFELLFQRSHNKRKIMLDCCWIDSNGEPHHTSHLRADISANNIYDFLLTHTQSTDEKKHHLLPEKSAPTKNKKVIEAAYQCLLMTVENNEYPIFKHSLLKQRLDKNILNVSNKNIKKVKI